MKTIVDFLEKTAKTYPNKIAYSDISQSLTYSELVKRAKSIASFIAQKGIHNSAIAIYDNRNVNTITAMFGVLYSGNYYVIIDSHSPAERVQKIYDILSPVISIYENENTDLVNSINTDSKNVLFLDASNFEINDTGIKDIGKKMISTDPAYVLFTSGSTGAPKGTIVSHQNVISYIGWFKKEFNINSNTIFGNQAAFYFSVSVSDIYSTVFSGATFNIIPRSYFAFPIKLIEFLNERKINTIYWVPTALCICANMKLFDYAKPLYLKRVLFAGEVMPNKQLNYWRRNLKNIKYANLFGPTETTDICTFYMVNRKFKDDEPLPIGVHCDNADTFLIDENGKLVTEVGVVGELFVRSPFVAYGYINNPDKTDQAFVQNPLHNKYPEKVYRTGDLAKINKFGEYEYVGRRDFQIKHLGYRIELGEIEMNASSLENVNTVVCIYDKEKDEIVMLYQGRIAKNVLFDKLKDKVPHYMMPNQIIKLAEMPLNANGKIDRAYLNKNYMNYIGENK